MDRGSSVGASEFRCRGSRAQFAKWVQRGRLLLLLQRLPEKECFKPQEVLLVKSVTKMEKRKKKRERAKPRQSNKNRRDECRRLRNGQVFVSYVSENLQLVGEMRPNLSS